jgi:uncharacterized protein
MVTLAGKGASMRDGTGAPSAGGDRSPVIDALRAIALFGVIAYNMVAMVAGFASQELLARATPADMAFALVDLVLIQGKARACFALLFGVGFGILMARGGADDRPGFVPFFLRRMAVLLGFGLVNLAFLFFGDILILYAVLGTVLLAFRGWAADRLLRVGLALVILPPVMIGLIEIAAGGALPNLAGLSPQQVGSLMPHSAPIYRAGSYGAFVLANLRYYLDHYRADTVYAAMYDLSVLGLFMLGLWAARIGLFASVAAHRLLLLRIAFWSLPLGLVLSIVSASRRLGVAVDPTSYGLVTASYAGVSIMAFGYIAVAALFLDGRGRGVARALAPAGRMALTGYLASNAIGSFTWYGWGLGRMQGATIAGINLFAIGLFAALALFSAAWLRLFRFGPVEWLWRSATYARWQPLRRAAA